MNHFASHDDQTLADLGYGQQLAGCRTLGATIPGAPSRFSWDDAPTSEPPWSAATPTAARTNALDAADLMTCYRRAE